MRSTNESDYDLLLCGGGVVGLSIAYQCALHGWRVLLLEAEQVGKGSSWAGAGILPAGASKETRDPTEQLKSLSHRLHAEWSRALREQTGIDNEYRQCGGVYLASTAAERATLAANQMWWDEHGIRYEAWSLQDVKTRLPAIHPDLLKNPSLRAWFFPDDCRLRNPRHILALKIACQQLGVTILEHAKVERVHAGVDCVESVQVGTNVYRAGRYCITSGAWASQLLSHLNVETGILPVRGQMVLYKLDQPSFSMIINDGHRYLVPRDDGYVLAGSCEEEVGFDARTTPEMIAQLQQWAAGTCPALVSSRIERTWAGLRPGSFDSLPYMGTIHPFCNAFLAAGHFRNGLHWSTATGLLMYQWMSGGKTEMDLNPFCIQRGQTLGMQLFN